MSEVRTQPDVAGPVRLGAGPDDAGDTPELSVVILASAAAQPLAALYREYLPALKSLGRSIEFVIAGEHWNAGAAREAREAADPDVPLRIVLASQSVGATGLLRLAIAECRASSLLIIASDRRVEPTSLPALIHRLDEADMVLGRRTQRRDAWINRAQERVFNWLVARLTSCRFTDLGSGVRAMRREILDRIPLYGESYRFLPVLAMRDGYRVVEQDVVQHDSRRKAELHAPTVYLRRLLDIFGLYFLVRFTEKPLRFFGLVGSLLAFAGAAITGVLFVQRLGGTALADRPLLLLGVLLLVLGIQVIALGLVGEIIVHTHAARTRHYRLARSMDGR